MGGTQLESGFNSGARVARDENFAAGVSPPSRIDLQDVEARVARDTFRTRAARYVRSTLAGRTLSAG